MDIFVARQPIFDRRRVVVAYELLFRSGLENVFGQHDPHRATMQIMNTTLLGFGLDALVGDKPAFLNAPREVLVRQHWAVLPPARTVVELLETVEPDAEVTAACAALKRAGYRLALDDFVFRPEYEALLPFADYIKVDFLITRGAERTAVARRLGRPGTLMLAEKVETHEDFRDGLAAGYELFQGYFFCRPEVMTGKDIPAVKVNLLRLLHEINRPELDFDRLERLIKQEVALSVKLLRYLHSASFGWRHEVASIGHAIRLMGEQATRKWASLVAVTLVGDDKPAELVTTSLVRAQFCEEIGVESGLSGRSSDLFLTGLFSTLDAMLDRPLEQVLEQMSVAPEIREALLGGEGRLGDVLAMAMAYDRGDWERISALAARLGVAEPRLPEAYNRAMEWVGKIFAA